MQSVDWRDGFLFVANSLPLDLVNTRLVVDGSPLELLPDHAALQRWVAAAGIGSARKITQDLASVLEFREYLRKAVFLMEAGKRPSKSWIERLNQLLAASPPQEPLVATDAGGFIRQKQFDLQSPGALLALLADEAANLIVTMDPARLRKCANCVVHFYDTSKKGTRRWCSMNLCGNQIKVRAYTNRKREAAQIG